MPEGDTIARTARALHEALTGRRVTALASSLVLVEAAAERLGVVGQTVAAVEPRGKHLLLRFSGGAVLHTHLGMKGSWRLRREVPGRPAAAARVSGFVRLVLSAGEVQAWCQGAPVVELLSAGQAARHPALARLGPDLLAADFEPAQARARLRARGDTPIGEALLDQTALAGIGNVYKSEVLFECGIDPRAPAASLDDATLDRLVATATAQLHRNLGPGLRRTTSGLAAERFAVYRRTGARCRRCGASIERLVQGQPPRATYFCPRCQRG